MQGDRHLGCHSTPILQIPPCYVMQQPEKTDTVMWHHHHSSRKTFGKQPQKFYDARTTLCRLRSAYIDVIELVVTIGKEVQARNRCNSNFVLTSRKGYTGELLIASNFVLLFVKVFFFV